MIIHNLYLPFLFLIASACISSFERALSTIGMVKAQKLIKTHRAKFYTATWLESLYPGNSYRCLKHFCRMTKQITRIIYATMFCLYFLSDSHLGFIHSETVQFLFSVIVIVLLGLTFDLFGIFIGNHHSKASLQLLFPFGQLFILLFFPFSLFLYWLQSLLTRKGTIESAAHTIKRRLVEFVHETRDESALNPFERKLLLSLSSFRERIAREIMVPRIEVVSIDKEAPLTEALDMFAEEEYSRIPVFENSVDHIVGVLLYKDLLAYCHKHTQNEVAPPDKTKVAELIKPVIFSPETKKIGALLQDLRLHQSHLAIVVDEYGGTEGVVTIEDILEELVGEIADESDDASDELLFTPADSGGWIVDARMPIVDIEKHLKIFIPQSPEYDTLGGFVFHQAGSIPQKGWKMHHDHFDLEVLDSTGRAVKKIQNTPN